MTRTVCERCREPLDSDDPDAVTAVEIVKTVAFGPTVEYHDGVRATFHERCFPEGDPGYRRLSPDEI
jgi:hypothetical protein